MTVSFKDFVNEEMVAGDSGGDPVKIASGERSGAVTLGSPEKIGTKKKKDEE